MLKCSTRLLQSFKKESQPGGKNFFVFAVYIFATITTNELLNYLKGTNTHVYKLMQGGADNRRGSFLLELAIERII